MGQVMVDLMRVAQLEHDDDETTRNAAPRATGLAGRGCHTPPCIRGKRMGRLKDKADAALLKERFNLEDP